MCTLTAAFARQLFQRTPCTTHSPSSSRRRRIKWEQADDSDPRNNQRPTKCYLVRVSHSALTREEEEEREELRAEVRRPD
ncbi:hypothetical protein HGRIS_013965 [Hohenbuehelia grisea]|uniref:Uncharacterized protein n=1 Tax=Hohenbuehelia grisea TaxID=104357 RepID=A0ABR3JTL6_9AGAR